MELTLHMKKFLLGWRFLSPGLSGEGVSKRISVHPSSTVYVAKHKETTSRSSFMSFAHCWSFTMLTLKLIRENNLKKIKRKPN
jgi:hypothetical protein